MEVSMNTYLTVKEVASLLGKSGKFVYQHQREIPGSFKLAGAILFDKEILMSELRKLAQSSTKKTAPIVCGNRHGL